MRWPWRSGCCRRQRFQPTLPSAQANRPLIGEIRTTRLREAGGEPGCRVHARRLRRMKGNARRKLARVRSAIVLRQRFDHLHLITVAIPVAGLGERCRKLIPLTYYFVENDRVSDEKLSCEIIVSLEPFPNRKNFFVRFYIYAAGQTYRLHRVVCAAFNTI